MANRDYTKYEYLFNKLADDDQQAGRELSNPCFKLLPSGFWVLPNVQQSDFPTPDILHIVLCTLEYLKRTLCNG